MLLIWPPGCVTLLPWDALLMMPIIDDALLASSVSIELVSSPARVTSVKFQQGQLETLGTQVYLGPIKMSSEMEVALPP